MSPAKTIHFLSRYSESSTALNRRTKLIYCAALIVTCGVAVLSLFLRVFRPQAYELTYFDPLIGWVGLAMALIALGPTMLAPSLYDVWPARVVLAASLGLAVFQALLVHRALSADTPPGDFTIYWSAGQRVYGEGQSPYSATNVVAAAFPFPTYLIYWFTSLGGRFTAKESFAGYTLASGILWLVSCIALWRHFGLRSEYALAKCWIVFWLLDSTGFEALVGLGQTTILVMVLIIGALIFLSKPSVPRWMAAGSLLGLGIMIKPQLAEYLVALAALLFLWISDRRTASLALLAIAGAVLTVLGGIGVSLILPGAVRLETYRQFLFEVYPAVNNPSVVPYTGRFGLVKGNASPVALVVTALGGLGLAPSSLTYSLVSLLATVLYAVLMLRRVNGGLPLSRYFLLWSFGPVLLTPLSHTYSVVWATPALLVLARDILILSRRADLLMLITIAIGLLRVQATFLTLFSMLALLILALQWLGKGMADNKYPALLPAIKPF